MKRVLLSLAVCGFAAISTGCMAVSATDNSRGIKERQQVVSVGGKVYIVDIKTGEAKEVDLKKARPMESDEMTVAKASK